ncbi:MAG: hypothetical protein WCP29_04170 [Acidobacteriota bacterium]
MLKTIFYPAAFLALFGSLPVGAQAPATNLRVQKAVREAVLKTREEAVILGSWVDANNAKYADPLTRSTGGSDADLRMRLTKNVPPEEALRRWKTFRDEVKTAVKAEFGRDAERVLATMNVYPPSQLMGAVEDTADAANRFRKLGTVPNLSFAGNTSRPLNPALVEGLYGHGSLAWTQEYERTKGKLFFVERGAKGDRVFTGTAELVNLIDGPQSYTAGGLGHTAEQWAEHGSSALDLDDGRAVEKYLGRTENDLAASRRLAQLDDTGPWRVELRTLREELAANPRALSRLKPRITEALRQATQAGQVLARLDNASGAQKAILKSFLRFAEDSRHAPKVITDALLTVPWSRLVEGAMLYVATAEISKAAADRDLAKALSEASPFLLSLGPATLTLLAQEILTQTRTGGYDLAAGYQDAFDLLAGLITMKGFEDVTGTPTASLDRLAERYREGQEEALRNITLNLCRNAATLNGKVDAGARDACYARCMPVLLKAWQARRDQWRKEAIALKASYGTLPFRLTYQPAPVPFDAAAGQAVATANYGFEAGSDDRLSQLRSLLRKLYGASAYADPVVQWDGGTPGTSPSTSRRYAFARPGTYTVSATRILRLGGWSAAGAAGGNPLAQQEVRQVGIVDVDVVGSAADAAVAPGPPAAAGAAAQTPAATGAVAKPTIPAKEAAPERLPATGVWVLEKTEFAVEKIDPGLMQKWQPSESGGDGAGSAQSTFGHPDPKISTVVVRMKIAWTSPPRVLIPGKPIELTVAVSDGGSEDPKGLGVGGVGSLMANCPALGAVWNGPSANFNLKIGERSKAATKTYQAPKAAPGTMMYIVAEYGVFTRRNQFFYTYKFVLDASNAPAPVHVSATPAATAAPVAAPPPPPPAAIDQNVIGTWNVSFNGWTGVMEIAERGGVYQGRFNLRGGGWEPMLELHMKGDAISFRRAGGDQRYVGVVADGTMRGTFSQGGAGSYAWTGKK